MRQNCVSAMTASGELLKKIDPEQYFDQFISESVYPDGRHTSQFRPFSVKQSVDRRAYGSALVQQGGASVSCTCDLSVAPDSDEPLILYELNWLECIPKKQLEEAELHLKRILRKNYLLDEDSLKIESTSSKSSLQSFDLRFTLHLNIMAISADGFLTDALLTAVQAAILDVSLPSVEYTGMAVLKDKEGFDDIPLQFDIKKLKIGPGKRKKNATNKLVLKDFLVYTPFLLYTSSFRPDNSVVLCDPAAELCALVKNRCEVITGSDGRFHALTFTSSVPFQNVILSEITQLAKRRHGAILNALKKHQESLQLF